jgi:hypothetical protein
MWDPNTSRVRETRDVTWLRWMFFQCQLLAADMVMEAIEFTAPGEEAREGFDPEDTSENEDEQIDDDEWWQSSHLHEAATRSGWTGHQPALYIKEIGAVTRDYEIGIMSPRSDSTPRCESFHNASLRQGKLPVSAQDLVSASKT